MTMNKTPRRKRQGRLDESAFVPLPGLDPVSLLDMPVRGRCRWPVGGAPGHFYCGAVTQNTYCETHAVRAYRPPKRE